MSTDLQSTEGVSVGHDDIVSVLGLEKELERLKSKIDAWIDASNEEMHACLKWQFSGKPKYFRPVTVFSCFKALHGEAIGEDRRRVSPHHRARSQHDTYCGRHPR